MFFISSLHLILRSHNLYLQLKRTMLHSLYMLYHCVIFLFFLDVYFLECEVEDESTENMSECWRTCVAFIRSAHAAGGKVLVQLWGRSRSASVVSILFFSFLFFSFLFFFAFLFSSFFRGFKIFLFVLKCFRLLLLIENLSAIQLTEYARFH